MCFFITREQQMQDWAGYSLFPFQQSACPTKLDLYMLNHTPIFIDWLCVWNNDYGGMCLPCDTTLQKIHASSFWLDSVSHAGRRQKDHDQDCWLQSLRRPSEQTVCTLLGWSTGTEQTDKISHAFSQPHSCFYSNSAAASCFPFFFFFFEWNSNRNLFEE